MKLIFRLLLLAAAFAGGIWLWTILFPNPEQVIRRHLAEVAADISFKSGQNPLLTANNVEKLTDLFNTNAVVQVNVPGRVEDMLTGRTEITQAAAAAHRAFSELKVRFLDINVAVTADKQSAIAELTVKAHSNLDKDFIVQELKFTFQKIGGDWLITRVETVRPLS